VPVLVPVPVPVLVLVLVLVLVPVHWQRRMQRPVVPRLPPHQRPPMPPQRLLRVPCRC